MGADRPEPPAALAGALKCSWALQSMLGLAIAVSPDKGRHVVTTRSFTAGQLVLSQQPYAAVLLDDQVRVPLIGSTEHAIERGLHGLDMPSR
jgi:hypothetical protein